MSFCSFILHQLDAGNGPREVGSYNTDATWGVSESLGRGRPSTNQNICLGFGFFLQMRTKSLYLQEFFFKQ